ncbi:hypothetical protein EV193_101468 [Herbihabitans rhizosphaerae]|uniref:Uncharacterized protein n=1 Tax=Herbihabitans rhizosphaerae TaxID=1872711 RepID=A0A4Q7L878_9PSEU|nr:hypothetical protein [Herbihabitans rhizosphaerae]RZS44592.1 hypothetical protein EV193_101468 [Herbihabitans rhizosphaerae]
MRKYSKSTVVAVWVAAIVTAGLSGAVEKQAEPPATEAPAIDQAPAVNAQRT